jgi:hypothetical protein
VKNMGRNFLSVTVQIKLMVEGKPDYESYRARELQCIANTKEESEKLYGEIEALMHQYGEERPEPIKVISP